MHNLIDTHVHFWELKNKVNSWVINSQDNHLMQDYNLNTYAKKVYGIVVVESVDLKHNVYEAKWLQDCFLSNELAIKIKHIAGIDILQNHDEFAIKLEEFAKFPFVVGFRHILSYDADAQYRPCSEDITNNLKSPAITNFIQNLRLLKEQGYIFNCQMYPNQLIQIYDILMDIGIKCTIDHCGLPLFADEKKRVAWLKMLKTYANSDIVFKLSGFDMNDNEKYFIDIVNVMLDNLPTENLIFGSNYPLSSNVKQIEQLEKLLNSKNQSYYESIFYSNAKKLYEF